MALRPDIIMAGQPIDIVGSFARGNELAAQTNQLQDQNALRQVYKTQGAGILQGNQSSLNALAAIDPITALSAQGNVLTNRNASRSFEIMNAQEKRAIAEAAAQMDEREKAEAAASVKQEVMRFIAAPTPEIFDQMVTQAGKPELAGMWANRQVLGAEYVSSVEEALKLSQPARPDPTEGAPSGTMWIDPNNRALGVQPLPGAEKPEAPYSDVGKLQADLRAGRIDQAAYEAELARIAPRGTSIEMIPGGGFRFNEGPGVKPGDGFQPSDPLLMVDSINGILNDPALPFATGWLEWTQNIPGTGSKRFGTRVAQLNGQAFLQAFESLKGAGQITEIEGTKATQAIGRLDSAQSAEDYQQALTELRDLLMLGASTEPGGAVARANPANPVATPTAQPPAAGNAGGVNWRIVR